jgi:hypothetical protein
MGEPTNLLNFFPPSRERATEAVAPAPVFAPRLTKRRRS